MKMINPIAGSVTGADVIHIGRAGRRSPRRIACKNSSPMRNRATRSSRPALFTRCSNIAVVSRFIRFYFYVPCGMFSGAPISRIARWRTMWLKFCAFSESSRSACVVPGKINSLDYFLRDAGRPADGDERTSFS